MNKITIKVEGGVIQWQEVDLPDGEYEATVKQEENRSPSQNSGQWLWFTQIANVLNRLNLPIEQLLQVDVNWTKKKVKYMFFDPVMEASCGVKSSTKLKMKDYEIIIFGLTKAFGEKGITIPAFPSIEIKEAEERYG